MEIVKNSITFLIDQHTAGHNMAIMESLPEVVENWKLSAEVVHISTSESLLNDCASGRICGSNGVVVRSERPGKCSCSPSFPGCCAILCERSMRHTRRWREMWPNPLLFVLTNVTLCIMEYYSCSAAQYAYT